MIRARVIVCPHCHRHGALDIVRTEPTGAMASVMVCRCMIDTSRWLRQFPLHNIAQLLGVLRGHG